MELSRFLAGFIGASNFLPGTVDGRDRSATIVALRGGARVTVPGSDAAGPVLLALRPEAISVEPLARNAGPAPNSTPATVEQVIYRGGLTPLYLRLDGGEALLAFHQNRAGDLAPAELSLGARVMATWTADNNHLTDA